MKPSKKRLKRKQSNLSRVLASSNRQSVVHKNFFSLSPAEIRASAPKLIRHRHFERALYPNRDGASGIYSRHTNFIPLEKCLSWCLGLLEIHADVVIDFLKTQDLVLSNVLFQEYEEALSCVSGFEDKFGISAWSTSLQGTLLSIVSPGAQREFLEDTVRDSKSNDFFKALAFNLTNRFDDPEALQSESKFFELKIKRTFSGRMLNFLMYKLLPFNVEFKYDFEMILDIEKDSSAVDVFLCLTDFAICNMHSQDVVIQRLCKTVLSDLSKRFQHQLISDLAVAFGLLSPELIARNMLAVVDDYTSGDYASVHNRMLADVSLISNFGLVEIWAKSLARSNVHHEGLLSNILVPLVDVITRSQDYERACAELFAYCHAFSMFKWFRELRYFLERETRFYSREVNELIFNTSLLCSSLSTPAKLQVLARRGLIPDSDLELLMPQNSVTSKLFSRMRAQTILQPTADELEGIELSRQLRFCASWNVSRGRYEDAIPILETLVKSSDVRTSQDASKALVEVYRAIEQPEMAAQVYVGAVLENSYLLSAFDSKGLSDACASIIKTSKSVSVPIALSLHSRYVGDDYDAALKYSFECFLKNNDLVSPLQLLTQDAAADPGVVYFLRYICTPEVMKLYLYFDGPKQIEQCRVEICKFLLTIHEGDEELLFEVKDRTRRLVLREAVNQVQSGRIFSDANFLTGPTSSALKALYERFASLRQQDFSSLKDEVSLQEFLRVMRQEKSLIDHAHAIHIQDLVLNEKNAVFLKLIKLVRDEFAFGERGLNLYLSTRVRHGHFPTAIRKPLLENKLLASKATDAAEYKLARNWQVFFQPAADAESVVESSVINFSLKFNELIDEVNDKWFRIFTIDQDISGLRKEGEVDNSLFNYSVTALEAYYLQSELSVKASYTDFIASVSKWLWVRTEQNLINLRERLSNDMNDRAFSMLDELGKSVISKCGMETLGYFPDALARARNGLLQAFETVQGWFARAQGGNLKEFEIDIPVQIVSMAIDVEVSLDDQSKLCWDGQALNALVDALFILFENAVSKSKLSKQDIDLTVSALTTDEALTISVRNNCARVVNILEANEGLERYRNPERYQSAASAAQGEGGSGFFKLWHLLEKDMGLAHQVSLGFTSEEMFQVDIVIPLAEFEKVRSYESFTD
nr:hypothetical protein [Pseudomonas sp. P818]